MKSYEMVETLSEKTKVSLEIAKDALEKCDWDMLDAAIYIEKNKPKRTPPPPPHGEHRGYPSSYQKPVDGQYFNPQYPPHADHGFPEENYTQFSGAPHPPFDIPPHHVPPHGPHSPHGQAEPFHIPEYKQEYNQPPVSVGELLGRVCGIIEGLVNKGMFDCFVVYKKDKRVFQIPLSYFLFILFFGACWLIPLLIVGLFFDFRYAFEGISIGKKALNEFLEKAKQKTDKMKGGFKKEYDEFKVDFQKEYDSYKNTLDETREKIKQERDNINPQHDTLKDDFPKGDDSTDF